MFGMNSVLQYIKNILVHIFFNTALSNFEHCWLQIAETETMGCCTLLQLKQMTLGKISVAIFHKRLPRKALTLGLLCKIHTYIYLNSG